jgi:hypothetical protein
MILSKDKKRKISNFFNFDLFNKPSFKIPLGSLIILATLIGTFKLVKALPMMMKLLIIGIDFTIIYLVIIYLFKNKN